MSDAAAAPDAGPPGGWARPDLASATLADLFGLYGNILDELTSRAVIRTRNQPLGDYAEWLTARALGARQATNKSEKAFDLVADLTADLLAGTGPHAGGHRGARVQVKARAVASPARVGQLQTSVFHRGGFDYLVLVLHEEADFAVRRAVLLQAAAAYVHARAASARRDDVLSLTMTDRVMTDPGAVDLTGLLRRAAHVAH